LEHEPDAHFAAFFLYCCDKLGISPDGSGNANKLYRSFQPYLTEFGGRIIFPEPDSWSIECLEFNTPEDLIMFKLKFN
jgi:hypothetical protein